MTQNDDYRRHQMKRFAEAAVYGAGLALGVCVMWFVVWPWIKSW